jgi:hypothetical protein
VLPLVRGSAGASIGNITAGDVVQEGGEHAASLVGAAIDVEGE